MKRSILFGVVASAVIGLNLGACSDDDVSTGIANEISSSSEDAANEMPAGTSALIPEDTISNVSADTALIVPADSSTVPVDTSAMVPADTTIVPTDSAAVPTDSMTIAPADTAKISYVLKPYDGPLANPHKGFTVPVGGTWTFVPEFEYGPYGELNNRAWDLITYGSGYFQWDSLNPGEGVYNWAPVEKILEACQKNGLTYALRVLPYTPSFIEGNDTPEEKYDWTPKWVYEKGAKKITAKTLKDGYDATVPVWDDSIYLQAAKDFGTALAEKYDGDPRLEYIDIRSFGEWGEWHASHLVGSEMPSAEIEKDMLKHYASVFKKTLIVLPSNGSGDVYTYALSLGIAKRDDGFIGTPGRADSLVRCYKAGLPTIAENLGGYQTMLTYNDVIPGGYLKWTPQRWVDAITTAHLTYYVLDQDSDDGYYFYKDNKALADSMTHVIGYNFTIAKAELLTVTEATVTTNKLNIAVRNSGVAPCFFDVYLVAEFVDGEGTSLAQIGKTVHIPKKTFKDGMTQEFSFTHEVPARQTNVAALPGVTIALSIYESADSHRQVNPI